MLIVAKCIIDNEETRTYKLSDLFKNVCLKTIGADAYRVILLSSITMQIFKKTNFKYKTEFIYHINLWALFFLIHSKNKFKIYLIFKRDIE